MNYSGEGNDKVATFGCYVAEGTYPADICVLRYALEQNARTMSLTKISHYRSASPDSRSTASQ